MKRLLASRPAARLSSVAAAAPVGSKRLMSSGLVEPAVKPKFVVTQGGRSSVSGVVATVFGATGFVGKYVVERLAGIGSQIIVPYRCDGMATRPLKVSGDLGQVVPVPAKITSEADVRRSLSRSNVVINLIGSFEETKNYTFHDAHVKTSYRIAKIAKEMGVERFIQLSAVNADVRSESKWLSTKAEADNAVRAFFPDSTVLKCTNIYGEDDSFVQRLAEMTRYFPIVPTINHGMSFVQPIFVLDVANAIMNALAYPDAVGKDYYLGGPQVLRYSELLELLCRESILPSKRYNLPFPIAHAAAKVVANFPRGIRLMTGDEIVRLQYDSVVPDTPGTLKLADLFITPHEFQPTIARCMTRHRGGRDMDREDAPPPLDVV